MVTAFAFLSVVAFAMRPLFFDGDEDDATLQVGSGGWVVLAGLLSLLVGAILTPADRSEAGAPSSSDRPADSDDSNAYPLAWSIAGIAGVALCWIGSFLPILGAAGSFGDGSGGDDSINAWDSFMRPVFGLPAILATVVVALAVAEKFKKSLGVQKLDLSIRDVKIGTSIYAALVAIALLIGNPFFGNMGGLTESKYGHFLMVVGALALCAASVMTGRAGSQTPGDIAISAD